MSTQDVFLPEDVAIDVATELKLPLTQVKNTLTLLLSDCTVPFIARYRKEQTGSLDEVQIRDIRDRYDYVTTLMERKEAILKSIEEQGKLSPELRARIVSCKSKTELEDLYLPYKPKKRTRGQIAKERGLEPLCLEILSTTMKAGILAERFSAMVGTHADLTTVDLVMAGCRDFIAEIYSETAEIRGEIRQWTYDFGVFKSTVREEHKDKKTKYNNYYDFAEPVKTIASHRLMALRRGEKEDVLRVALDVEQAAAIEIIEKRALKTADAPDVREFLKTCVRDAYVRILATSIETELRLETKNRAEEEAIRVFAKNLRSLLLLPPIPRKMVLGIDPGFRTGSKLVVVDNTGKLVEHTTIYPDHEVPVHSPRNENAVQKFVDLVKAHKIECISVGNGTAGREMEAFAEYCVEKFLQNTAKIAVVNESGASVYSASDIAREEFPDLDITYRGAVSIARRLQDPLAELVKIDPKSIGVGQYQHDVNQAKLKRSLEEVVESCVNYVGVNINTASPSLLSYVSGIGPSLARSIVQHRNTAGEFKERAKLLEVAGFGPKTFEQAAGFLRIPESANPLDNSAVHPEAYSVVERMALAANMPLSEFVGNKEALKSIKLSEFVADSIGLVTLQDIVKELSKPGRDPREEGNKHSYSKNVRSFEDLVEGAVVAGTVTNVTNFGAFVDIGVHQDGLVHISELCNEFIKNPADVINVGEQILVKVIGVDKERKRISLSRKAVDEEPGAKPAKVAPEKREPTLPAKPAIMRKKIEASSAAAPAPRENKAPAAPRMVAQSKKEPVAPTQPASVGDLLSKFNKNRL